MTPETAIEHLIAGLTAEINLKMVHGAYGTGDLWDTVHRTLESEIHLFRKHRHTHMPEVVYEFLRHRAVT